MTDRYALFATASLHDVQVDEVSVPAGRALTVGRGGDLRLPVPAGAPYVAEARWSGPDRVAVLDGQGNEHLLGPDDALSIALGPVRLDLRLVRQFAFRRTYPVAWSGSLAWLLTVLAVSLLVAQVEFVWSMRCAWFGVDCPVQVQVGVDVNVDFIARLLDNDLDGAEDGQDARREVPDLARKMPSVFMPAGDPYGPRTEQGGAEEVAPVPDRQPPIEKVAIEAAPRKIDTPELTAEADDAQVVLPKPDEDQPEGEADRADGAAADDEVDEDEDPSDPIQEEEEGFGLSDWLDASPEEREIQLALRVAKQRLRIDPNDPGALSLLAYYQYLAEDLDAAEATYDKLIELEPEDAAAYNNKALVYKRRKDYAKEEGLYRVALAIEPGDVTAMNNLAVNLSHQGRHEEAWATMQRLEKLLPGDPYSDLHRAKILAQMDRDEEALRMLDRALAGMAALDTLHHIEFRQDIRIDPSFARLRDDPRFRATLKRYYGDDSPLQD